LSDYEPLSPADPLCGANTQMSMMVAASIDADTGFLDDGAITGKPALDAGVKFRRRMSSMSPAWM
jgi:hypothetical protein